MDPAGPPNGTLEDIFNIYDIIRSEGHLDDNQPPWQPAKVDAPNTTTPAAPSNTPSPDSKELIRLGYKQRNWNDVRADKEERAAKLLDQRYQEKVREAAGKQNMMKAINNPNRGTHILDEHGLNEAYKDPETGTYYDPGTRTLHIRGSVTGQDWKDDFTKIPFWGDSRDIEMYKNAKKAYDNLINQGKAVDRVVGHSLGGSVALQLQKDKDIPFSRTYGAPVVDLNPFQKNVERYRHPLDPFSILDRGASNVMTSNPYTHSYAGYSNMFTR
jgi:hypothetical protein